MKDIDFIKEWMGMFDKPIAEEVLNDYFEKWIECSVTLRDWEKYCKYDHWGHIEQCYNLNENEIEEIESFQESLFMDSVNEFVSYKIKKFNDLHESIQIEAINNSLKIIDDFTQSTKVNSIIYDSITTLVSFREKDFKEVLKAYKGKLTENVSLHSDIKYKYLINQLDTNLDNPNYTANKIFYLKKALIQLKNEILLPNHENEILELDKHESENDFNISTIEDWLFEFKSMMSENDYNTLVSAINTYLQEGKFPMIKDEITINGRPNKKLVGWALNRIFEANGKGVEKELLIFAKNNISIFKNVTFDENNYLKSNLYKYFTTKTK